MPAPRQSRSEIRHTLRNKWNKRQPVEPASSQLTAPKLLDQIRLRQRPKPFRHILLPNPRQGKAKRAPKLVPTKNYDGLYQFFE